MLRILQGVQIFGAPALRGSAHSFRTSETEISVTIACRRSFSMSATRTLTKDITRENRADHPVVQHLQRQVANAFVLYANYKHYHWQTFGPLFRDLHLMFDDFAKEVLDTIDEMAERIRMIGQDIENVQLKQMQEAANAHSSVPGQTAREMIEEADANSLVVIKDLREGAKLADESNDPGTVDLFSKIVQIHEKQEWFLRQLLKKNDGFVS
jgi:starvation-inducible DNA-binding protein